jgi:diguanylate cyclase (GGDEF)-like protein
MYGVELHANIVSQIISTTLNGRPLIRSFPEPTEILLILGFAYLELLLCTKGSNSWQIYGATGLFIAGIWGLSYLLLLNGWWFPVVPVSMSIGMTSGLVWIYNIYQLKTLSHKDELTQLANRRAFDQRLQQEWERVMRSQHYLSVILCDVDYFKLYNDTYGHPQGDECLRLVAKAIRNTALPSDALAARYGGEEFVIVLPEVEPEAALEVAERMRASIQAIKLPHRESRVSSFVTLSLGVSGVVPSKAISPSTLVGTADVGLYAAKREGRDRAVLKLI